MTTTTEPRRITQRLQKILSEHLVTLDRLKEETIKLEHRLEAVSTRDALQVHPVYLARRREQPLSRMDVFNRMHRLSPLKFQSPLFPPSTTDGIPRLPHEHDFEMEADERERVYRLHRDSQMTRRITALEKPPDSFLPAIRRLCLKVEFDRYAQQLERYADEFAQHPTEENSTRVQATVAALQRLQQSTKRAPISQWLLYNLNNLCPQPCHRLHIYYRNDHHRWAHRLWQPVIRKMIFCVRSLANSRRIIGARLDRSWVGHGRKPSSCGIAWIKKRYESGPGASKRKLVSLNWRSLSIGNK